MSTRLRLLTIACATVLFAGVVSAATYDDSVEVDQIGTSDEVATDESTTTAPASTGGDGVPDTAPTTTAAGAATTAAPETSAPATTAPPVTTATTAADEQLGTTPGTYTYDISGCCDQNGGQFSGVSTLTVSELDAEGRQTHTQQGPEGKQTMVYRHADEGTYLESLAMTAQGFELTLNATAPFLLLPSDAAEGTETSGRLRGSGLTADVTFTVQEFSSSTSTAELVADISGRIANTCDVDGTMTSTIEARTSDQLQLEVESRSNLNATGGLGLCPGKINSNSTAKLRQ